jgi:hypothetical protein
MPEPLPYLYIFLDESGDFNFTLGGTRFYTLTTVTLVRPFHLETALASIKLDLIEQGTDLHRFHASEDRQAVRDQVFQAIAGGLGALRIDSVIVEKRKTQPQLQPAETFYAAMIGYLLRHVLKQHPLVMYAEVVVLTDSLPLRKKREAFEKAIKTTLTKMLPAGTKYRVLHHPSMSCFMLQVADYCNWAIFKKWEGRDVRSYDIIKPAVKSEFDIFRTGETFYY